MNQENQNIEHKRIWKDEYLKWVSGFANAQGGKIYIGIDDDLTVVGVENLHRQLEDIPNKIINNTGVYPETNHLTIEGKDVIEIVIEPCGMPISYRGAYYYRSGATKQEYRGTALHQFLLKKMGMNWEDIPCDGSSIEDIDDSAITYFLNHAITEGRMEPESQNSSKEEVLSNLGLLRDGVPTNGAILLFGKYPQRRFVTSGFKIGRFGADDSDLLNQDLIEGNLIQMTDRIVQVLSSKYLIRPIHYEGLHRKEPLEIPEEALREIIFNSIVHKLQFGTWNQMSVYDDHIRLWNEGVLPDDYTVETLMNKHTSKPRNPNMAQVFYRAGFIEAWGRGYEKIMGAFDGMNLTRPTFTVEQGGVTALIPREVFMSLRGEPKPNQNRTKTDTETDTETNTETVQTDTEIVQTDTETVQTDTEATQTDTESFQIDPQLAKADTEFTNTRTKTEEKDIVLDIIRDNPSVTMDQLGDLLKISKSSVQRRLKALVKDGKVRHIGPTKGGHWEIQP